MFHISADKNNRCMCWLMPNSRANEMYMLLVWEPLMLNLSVIDAIQKK